MIVARILNTEDRKREREMWYMLYASYDVGEGRGDNFLGEK